MWTIRYIQRSILDIHVLHAKFEFANAYTYWPMQWRRVLSAEVVRAACCPPLQDVRTVRVDHFSNPTRTVVDDAYRYLYGPPDPRQRFLRQVTLRRVSGDNPTSSQSHRPIIPLPSPNDLVVLMVIVRVIVRVRVDQ